MKARAFFLAALVGCALSAAPALAQNYSPKAENHLQNFMSNHPELQSNPNLMNNPQYLRKHPNFAQWLKQHPNAKNEALSMGAYDNGHKWHNGSWWYNQDHDWMQHHQPSWGPNHASWANDGDWDDHHQWRDRDWWAQHDQSWAEKHHPNWYKHDNGHHYGWEKHGHDRDHDHDHDHH